MGDFQASLEAWQENIHGPLIRLETLSGDTRFEGRVTSDFLMLADEGVYYDMQGAKYVLNGRVYETLAAVLAVILRGEFNSLTVITLVKDGTRRNRCREPMWEVFKDAYDIVTVFGVRGTAYYYPRALIPDKGVFKMDEDTWRVES